MASAGAGPGRGSAVAELGRGLMAVLDISGERVAAVRSRHVLAALAATQWLLLAVLALRAGHDGWVYDPAARPGAGVVSALPGIVLFQTLVLLPLALVLVFAVARELAGRVFAAWAATVWVLLPYAGIVFANRSFRHAYVDRFLTHAVGLAADPAFPALVLFLLASLFALRAARAGAAAEVAGAVVAAAAAVAFAPRAATVAIVPVAALAAGGRRRATAAAALLLAVLLLGVGLAVHAGLLAGPLGRVSPGTAGDILASLKETFWSGRVLEWLLAAGIVGALRGRLPAGTVVAVASLAGFLSISGGADPRSASVAMLQGVLPAWFAIVLAVASIPLLAPRGGARRPAAEVLEGWRGRLLAPVRGGAAVEDRESSRAVPMPLWAAIAISCFVGVMLFVGIWNATRYPVALGYDAAEHIAYADQLIQQGKIPTQAQGGEYYTPPGYYALAGAATWVGGRLGMDDPHRAAQVLNILFVLATAALLLALARMLFPRRPVLWVAAVGFFAFLPVVSKTAAMFHPETLNMLVSTAAVTLGVRMLLRRDFGLRWLALLGCLLGLGQLVRASSLFTLAAVGIAFLAALGSGPVRRQISWRKVALALAALVVVVTPWYARQVVTYHKQPIYVNTALTQQLFDPAPYPSPPRPPYFGIALDDIFNRPVRPFYENQSLSETYTEIWGDWTGNFAWSGYSQGPSPGALVVLKNQSTIGVLPTFLAIAGWLALVALALTGRIRRLPFLPVILLPAIALGAYLWRGYIQTTPDGDLFKASYLLTTAPLWALAFGLAAERLVRRRPLVAAALVTVFLVSGVLELRFMLYGVREHMLPF